MRLWINLNMFGYYASILMSSTNMHIPCICTEPRVVWRRKRMASILENLKSFGAIFLRLGHLYVSTENIYGGSQTYLTAPNRAKDAVWIFPSIIIKHVFAQQYVT